MADRIDVATSIGTTDVLVGALYVNHDSGTFTYDPDYLARRDKFALAPSLQLVQGPQQLDKLGAFSDAAPDRWGRRMLARAENRTSLPEFDYLFGVSDFSRQGATRFIRDGDVLSERSPIPPERDLGALLDIADQVQRDPKAVKDIDARRLFEATGSLGGARPKASILYRERLALAKFPKPNGDDWDVMGWEATMLHLQARLGIDVPGHHTLRILDGDKRERHVLVLERFDRDGHRRIPYISAMTMLEARDGAGGDWLDLVEAAREHGADPMELWRRAAFGALVGNRDNHLRNHGFLRARGGWHLSPAFDVNPTPLDEGDVAQLALMGNATVTPERLLESENLELFDTTEANARTWMRSAATVLADVEREARAVGVDAASIAVMGERMEAARVAAAELGDDVAAPPERPRERSGRFASRAR